MKYKFFVPITLILMISHSCQKDKLESSPVYFSPNLTQIDPASQANPAYQYLAPASLSSITGDYSRIEYTGDLKGIPYVGRAIGTTNNKEALKAMIMNRIYEADPNITAREAKLKLEFFTTQSEFVNMPLDVQQQETMRVMMQIMGKAAAYFPAGDKAFGAIADIYDFLAQKFGNDQSGTWTFSQQTPEQMILIKQEIFMEAYKRAQTNKIFESMFDDEFKNTIGAKLSDDPKEILRKDKVCHDIPLDKSVTENQLKDHLKKVLAEANKGMKENNELIKKIRQGQIDAAKAEEIRKEHELNIKACRSSVYILSFLGDALFPKQDVGKYIGGVGTSAINVWDAVYKFDKSTKDFRNSLVLTGDILSAVKLLFTVFGSRKETIDETILNELTAFRREFNEFRKEISSRLYVIDYKINKILEDLYSLTVVLTYTSDRIIAQSADILIALKKNADQIDMLSLKIEELLQDQAKRDFNEAKNLIEEPRRTGKRLKWKPFRETQNVLFTFAKDVANTPTFAGSTQSISYSYEDIPKILAPGPFPRINYLMKFPEKSLHLNPLAVGDQINPKYWVYFVDTYIKAFEWNYGFYKKGNYSNDLITLTKSGRNYHESIARINYQLFETIMTLADQKLKIVLEKLDKHQQQYTKDTFLKGTVDTKSPFNLFAGVDQSFTSHPPNGGFISPEPRFTLPENYLDSIPNYLKVGVIISRNADKYDSRIAFEYVRKNATKWWHAIDPEYLSESNEINFHYHYGRRFQRSTIIGKPVFKYRVIYTSTNLNDPFVYLIETRKFISSNRIEAFDHHVEIKHPYRDFGRALDTPFDYFVRNWTNEVGGVFTKYSASIEQVDSLLYNSIKAKLEQRKRDYLKTLKQQILTPSDPILVSALDEYFGLLKLVESYIQLKYGDSYQKDDSLRSIFFGLEGLPTRENMCSRIDYEMAKTDSKNLLTIIERNHFVNSAKLKNWLSIHPTREPDDVDLMLQRIKVFQDVFRY